MQPHEATSRPSLQNGLLYPHGLLLLLPSLTTRLTRPACSVVRKSFNLSPSGRELEALQDVFELHSAASRAARGSFDTRGASQVIELQPTQPPQPSPFASSDAAAVNVFIMLDAESLSAFRYIPSLNHLEDQRMLTLQVMALQAAVSLLPSIHTLSISLRTHSCYARRTRSRSASGRRTFSSDV
jgi:hypothetical protein